jgi:hypothetical protein
MLTAHSTVAFLVLGVTLVSAVWGGIAYFRPGASGGLLAHVLTLSQTLLVAQVARLSAELEGVPFRGDRVDLAEPEERVPQLLAEAGLV